MSEFWEVTISAYEGLITSPKLTEKLLKKPPFRFVYDIIMAIMTTYGFLETLISEDEKNYAYFVEKEQKTAFLDKVIYAVNTVLGIKMPVRSSKITAGSEVENTNVFLQALAKVVKSTTDKDWAKITLPPGTSAGAAATESKESKKSRTSSKSPELKDSVPSTVATSVNMTSSASSTTTPSESMGASASLAKSEKKAPTSDSVELSISLGSSGTPAPGGAVGPTSPVTSATGPVESSRSKAVTSPSGSSNSSSGAISIDSPTTNNTSRAALAGSPPAPSAAKAAPTGATPAPATAAAATTFTDADWEKLKNECDNFYKEVQPVLKGCKTPAVAAVATAPAAAGAGDPAVATMARLDAMLTDICTMEKEIKGFVKSPHFAQPDMSSLKTIDEVDAAIAEQIARIAGTSALLTRSDGLVSRLTAFVTAPAPAS